MAEVVEIIVKLTDQVAPAARKITKELTAVQKAGRNLKKGVGAGVEVLSKIPAVAAAAAAALAVAKKAFDFAQQGAQIQQMGESWDFLMAKVGVSPGILDDLSKAARGTITEMQIMTSTATLLAGAGDELAKSMAEASPRLLEIAKAANKLNPSLGDTTFLYESIARGVKRASPLILDNLGITIKIGRAYEEFAKQLGVSAKELTAEQRQMAVLNATLKAGDNLISQVGGNVDSVTDSFAQLTTATGEIANMFKTDLFNALGPIITNLAEGAMASIEYANAVEQLGLSGFEAGRLLHDFDGTTEEAKESIILMARGIARADLQMLNLGRSIRGLPPIKFGLEGPTDEEKEEVFKDFEDTAEEVRRLIHEITVGQRRELEESLQTAGPMEIPFDVLTTGVNQKLKDTAVEAAAIPVAAGDTAAWAAAREVAQFFGGDINLAFIEIQKVTKELKALDGTEVTVDIVFNRIGDDSIPRASGGPLTGVNLVGEQGPELIINGVVIPAETTRKLQALGLGATKKLGLGGAIDISLPSSPIDFSFAGDPISDPTVRAGLNIPTGGGGGGASSVVAAAVQASMAVTQGAAQETAAVVAAAVAPQVAQQSQQILTMQARTAEAAARNESLLSQILDALITQGTSDDTGDAMAEAIQFLDA